MASTPKPVDFAGPKSLWVSPDCFPIEPSDTDNLPSPVRAIRANTEGNVKITTWAGEVRVLAFADAETRYIAATKVHADGTTATGLEGMT